LHPNLGEVMTVSSSNRIHEIVDAIFPRFPLGRSILRALP
jgi:hypothetical protein